MLKNSGKKRLSWVKLCCFVVVLLLSTGGLFAQAQDDYKETKVTLKVDNMPVGQVLDTLSAMADVKFFYNHAQLDAHKTVTLDVTDRPLSYVLIIVLADQPVDIDYQSNRVVVLKAKAPLAQPVDSRKVNGQVVDASTGDPLPGAFVVLKETPSIGVSSDMDGRFELNVPSSITAVVVSFVGYEEQEVALTGDLENLKVELKVKQEERLMESL